MVSRRSYALIRLGFDGLVLYTLFPRWPVPVFGNAALKSTLGV